MSEHWTWPAEIGLLFGALLLAALFVPILLVQTRRYGRLSARRVAGAAALAVYGVALLAYTLLPLPADDVAAWCAQHGYDGAQLRPLQTVADIRERTAGMSIGAAVRSVVVLQGVFNVVLFVPWGMLARRYLGWGFWASTWSAFAASLLIETTQYTGVFGLIGCSYRLADVDDLLTNTLGGALGALAAPLVLRWMPQSRALVAARDAPRPVTLWRRWLGMLADAVLFHGLGLTLAAVWAVGHYAATGVTTADGGTGARVIEFALLAVVPWFVVFGTPLVTGSGESLGQRTLWLTVRPVPRSNEAAAGDRLDPSSGHARDTGEGLTTAARLRRGLAGGAAWGLLQVLALLARTFGVTALDAAGALAGLFATVCVVAALVSRDRRGLSGILAPYELADVRAVRGAVAESGRR